MRKGRRLTLDVALRAAPPAGKDDVRNLAGAIPSTARGSPTSCRVWPTSSGSTAGGRRHPVRAADSQAARIGFRPGDVIQQIGRAKVETVTTLEAAVKERQRVWLVLVRRGNQSMRLQLAG